MITPKPFTLLIPDAAIAELHERLARTRWPDEPPLPPWSTGTSVAYLRELIDYWRTGFDWRVWEANLNSFPRQTLAQLGDGGVRDKQGEGLWRAHASP